MCCPTSKAPSGLPGNDEVWRRSILKMANERSCKSSRTYKGWGLEKPKAAPGTKWRVVELIVRNNEHGPRPIIEWMTIKQDIKSSSSAYHYVEKTKRLDPDKIIVLCQM